MINWQGKYFIAYVILGLSFMKKIILIRITNTYDYELPTSVGEQYSFMSSQTVFNIAIVY